MLLISILCLSGCENDAEKKPSETTSKPSNNIQTKIVTPKENSLLRKALKTSYLNDIVDINGRKFKSLDESLTTSSKLLDVKNSSVGRITGSFIVASKTKPVPHLLGLTFNDDARQVAQDTWRFTANRGENFLLLDRGLKQIFKKVEMVIQYGDSDTLAR